MQGNALAGRWLQADIEASDGGVGVDHRTEGMTHRVQIGFGVVEQPLQQPRGLPEPHVSNLAGKFRRHEELQL